MEANSFAARPGQGASAPGLASTPSSAGLVPDG